MNLTSFFLQGISSQQLKSLTKIGDGKIAINSVALFMMFQNKITPEMRFLDILQSFEDIAKKSAQMNFERPPHPGSVNNCMGRWFELIFFRFFREILCKASKQGGIKEICKLPSATEGNKFIDLFVEEQKKILQEIKPATSNPDYVILSSLVSPIYAKDAECIDNFRNNGFYGKIDIHNIAAVLSIKTSARPDRRYQQVYEANLIKAIALRFNKTIKFISITLHENAKNEEVYYSPSIPSIVLRGKLEPTVDCSMVLNKVSDVYKVFDIIFVAPQKPEHAHKSQVSTSI